MDDAFFKYCARHGLDDAARTELADLLRRVGSNDTGVGTRIGTVSAGESADQMRDTLAICETDRTTPALNQIGRYAILDLLGKGGMGAVFRAMDKRLDRTVALKIMLDQARPHTPRELERFMAEARVMARLQHPNILPIHEIGELENGRLFFTMELVRGRTLHEVIAAVHSASNDGNWRSDEQGFNLFRLVSALTKVCEAVSFAHSRDVIHRDIKPDNIMLGEHGEVQLLDWGVALVFAPTLPATHLSTDTMYGTSSDIIGTPPYMAPEQADGKGAVIDHRVDVYALGAVLHHIIFGAPPYHSLSHIKIIEALLTKTPPQAQSGAGQPRAPEELSLICARAMMFNTNDRYQSVESLAGALQSWLDGTTRKAAAEEHFCAAKRLLETSREIQAGASIQRLEGEQMLDPVAPWSTESHKVEAWRILDEAEALALSATEHRARAEELLTSALAHAPEHQGAHALLAKIAQEAHHKAEAEHDKETMVRSLATMSSHTSSLNDGHPDKVSLSSYFRGMGALSFSTSAPGARLELYKYKSEGRRLRPSHVLSTQQGAFESVELPCGSYVIEASAPGFAPMKYPLVIGRNKHWRHLPPEATAQRPIALLPQDQLGPDEIYIPEGWFISGGDEGTNNPLPRRHLWMEGYVIERLQVTNERYLAFLDDIVEREGKQAAMRWAPKERVSSSPIIYGFDEGTRRFFLRPDVDGDLWERQWPVMMINWRCAMRFAAWQRETSGGSWSLPTALQWEKAARGADGRLFPWGHFLDPSWTSMKLSAELNMPETVGHERFHVDESPYGVRDMGGNVNEFCLDVYRDLDSFKRGIPQPEIEPQSGDVNFVAARGGSWDGDAKSCRCTSRKLLQTDYAFPHLGIRLARSVGQLQA